MARPPNLWPALAVGALLLAAGCNIHLAPSDADRLVSEALKKYDKPSLHVERVKVTSGAKGERETVFKQSKFGSTRYLYEFEGADRTKRSVFWDDRMINSDSEGKYAEEFAGLPKPSRDELRDFLLAIARRRLTENDATFSTGQRCGQWKTYRLIEIPRAYSDVAHRNECHFETETGATVLLRETDEAGKVVRETQALELSGPAPEPKECPAPEFAATVIFRLPGAEDRAPAGIKAPKPVLDSLAEPRYGKQGDVECWDFTKRGFIMALWTRPAPAGKGGASFISPMAATITAAGTEVRWWWCGTVTVHRWTAGGRELTAVTNLPPDLAKKFIEGNREWWKAETR